MVTLKCGPDMEQVIDVGCVKEEHCEAICNMFRTQDWQLTMRHRDLGIVKIEQDMSIVWQSTSAATVDNKAAHLDKQKR